MESLVLAMNIKEKLLYFYVLSFEGVVKLFRSRHRGKIIVPSFDSFISPFTSPICTGNIKPITIRFFSISIL